MVLERLVARVCAGSKRVSAAGTEDGRLTVESSAGCAGCWRGLGEATLCWAGRDGG